MQRPEVWLEFNYDNKSFDYALYDVDLAQLLDVIGELEEAAWKQNVMIPSVYDMYYKGARGKEIYVRNDRDLMTMFQHFRGCDTIKIWLEHRNNPLPIFEMFANLKRVQREVEERKQKEAEEISMREEKRQRLRKEEERLRKEEERNRLLREAIHVQPLTTEVAVFNLDSDETEWMRIYSSQEDVAETTPMPTEQPQPQPTPPPTEKQKPTPPPSEQSQPHHHLLNNDNPHHHLLNNPNQMVM